MGAIALVGAYLGVTATLVQIDAAAFFPSLSGNSVVAIVQFAVFVAVGQWILCRASGRHWVYAIPTGVLFALFQTAGASLSANGDLSYFSAPLGQAIRIIARGLGLAYLFSCAAAAFFYWVIRESNQSTDPITSGLFGSRSPVGKLVKLLQSSVSRSRRRGTAIVFGLLCLARIPYLLTWWPGIVAYDTFRAYAEARGGPWQAYEPVGYSIAVGIVQSVSTRLGFGDIGAVIFTAIVQNMAMAAVFAFMLARLAAWRLSAPVWTGAFVWTAIIPVFGSFAVTMMKDVPFALSFVVFEVCIGEWAFSRGNSPVIQRWPWITAAVSGLCLILTRSNGIYVVIISLALFLALWPGLRRRIGVVTLICALGYGLYVGPVYSYLHVSPGPTTEVLSIPLQQLARIARDDAKYLSASEKEFIETAFGMDLKAIGDVYDPELSDYAKMAVWKEWGAVPLPDLLTKWLSVAVHHPSSAITATLANTVGYWYPEGRSRDGLFAYSANDIRNVHLEINSNPPTAGVAGFVYNHDLLGRGFRSIPLSGMTLSTGFIMWLWLLFGLAAIVRRNRIGLVVFVPAAALWLTFIAGPVSGSIRYSLGLFMALPVAVASCLKLPARQKRIDSHVRTKKITKANLTNGPGELDL